MSKKIINITAAAMALAVTLSGCATAVVQERKDQAAEAASAEAAQAAVTATPEPTAEPTPEPINAWSLLSNLPDFTPGTLDNPDTTWPDGIPMGQSPLSYDDGSKFYSLRSVDTGKTLDITDVALQDVRDLPVKGYLKLNELENGDTVIGEINAESTGEGVEKEISDFSIHTASKDDGCDYYPIGYNGGSLTLMLDGRAANDDGINIGDAFLDGLYYSSVTPDKFDAIRPTESRRNSSTSCMVCLAIRPVSTGQTTILSLSIPASSIVPLKISEMQIMMLKLAARTSIWFGTMTGIVLLRRATIPLTALM